MASRAATEINASQVLRAYRQARNALLEERSGVAVETIAKFENEFDANVRRLVDSSVVDTSQIPVGNGILVPKSADAKGVKGQYQIQQSVESAVLDVFWLWEFGGALERTLDPACKANRLRRTEGRIDPDARHIYTPWRAAYSEFHREIRDVAAKRLARGGTTAIATFDIKAYYASIDIGFLISNEFVQRIERANPAFDTNTYVARTNQVVERYRRTLDKIQSDLQVTALGLPIGAVASRLIANLALGELDTLSKSKSGVVHYARWVDDIVFILDNSRTRVQPSKLLPVVGKDLIDPRRILRSNSNFVLNSSKQRVMRLDRVRGDDAFVALARELDAVSSYRSAFASGLRNSRQRADVLELARGHSSVVESERFQYFDGIKARRSASSALVSKALESAILSRKETERPRDAALRALCSSLVQERNWPAFFDILLRVLAVAVAFEDSPIRLEAISAIERWRTRAERSNPHLGAFVRVRLEIAIASAVPRFIEELKYADRTTHLAQLLARSGLRLLARNHDSADAISAAGVDTNVELDSRLRSTLSKISDYLGAARRDGPSLERATPFEIWLSHRPPSLLRVWWAWARSKPNSNSVPPIELVNAVRGTNYSRALAESVEDPAGTTIVPKVRATENRHVRVALGDILTTVPQFSAALSGRPDPSVERMLPIAEVAAAARRLRRHDEHLLLVLPELSTPRAIFADLAEALIKDGIGLVAGLEYEQLGNGEVANDVVAAFPRAFGGLVLATWRKTRPAVGEEAGALNGAGLRLAVPANPPGSLVVDSQYGALTVLICSELLEIEARARTLGRSDMILVPAWNRDTAYFEPVIMGASMDLHCYVGVANNSEFSDSRVRGPEKDRAARDTCRIIERMTNSVVSARIPIDDLRMFQLGIGAPETPFKPMPPGFKFMKPKRASEIWAELLRDLRAKK